MPQSEDPEVVSTMPSGSGTGPSLTKQTHIDAPASTLDNLSLLGPLQYRVQKLSKTLEDIEENIKIRVSLKATLPVRWDDQSNRTHRRIVERDAQIFPALKDVIDVALKAEEEDLREGQVQGWESLARDLRQNTLNCSEIKGMSEKYREDAKTIFGGWTFAQGYQGIHSSSTEEIDPLDQGPGAVRRVKRRNCKSKCTTQ